MGRNMALALDMLATVEHNRYELTKTDKGFICTITNGAKRWFALSNSPDGAILKAIALAE